MYNAVKRHEVYLGRTKCLGVEDLPPLLHKRVQLKGTPIIHLSHALKE